MNNKKKNNKKKGIAETKFLGIFGSMSSGLGIIGLHNVCHIVCEGLIAVLAIIGITIVGMPLAFLQDYSFLFGLMGLFSASAAILIFVWTKLAHKMKTGKRQLMWLSFNIIVLALSIVTVGGAL